MRTGAIGRRRRPATAAIRWSIRSSACSATPGTRSAPTSARRSRASCRPLRMRWPAGRRGAGGVEGVGGLPPRHKEEAERNWQQFLHAAADLENYKKQAARQREEAVQRTRTSLLYIVLDVVDNLERALGHAPDARGNAIVDGIRMAHRQGLDRLPGR